MSEQAYLDLLQKVLLTGFEREDRTGTGTYSLVGEQLSFDLEQGFPLLTTKRVHFASVVEELFWFLSGSTNVKPLQAAGVTIWDEWADERGELGPVYGSQWRSWGAANGLPKIDQLNRAITELNTNPNSRRIVVSAWDPSSVDKCALPPCHMLFQFLVSQDKWEPLARLNCRVDMRSADLFLGVPFNIASYALLTHIVAYITGLQPGRLVMQFGDVHLYRNHVEQAVTQLRRRQQTFPFPELVLSPRESDDSRDAGGHLKLEAFSPYAVNLKNYRANPAIKAQVSV